MLSFVHDDRLTSGRIGRRQWLQISSLAGLGLLNGPRAAVGDSRAGPTTEGFGRAKSVIVVFTSGGQSQLDMWDPKPQAPADVRGAFQPIATSLPGVQFCEHMPRIARIAKQLTVVRSMSHEDLDHGTAAYLALTGRYHTIRSGNPPPNPDDFPTFGAIVRRIRGSSRFLNDAVHLNGPALIPFLPGPGQNGGLLGRAYEPLVVGDVRESTGGLPALAPQPDLPAIRLNHRLSLKNSLDEASERFGDNRQALDMNRLYRQAYEMLASSHVRDAFDLDAEPAELRDRYGRHRSGQACLLARRLVEAGVPFVTVFWNHSNRGQDTNTQNTDLYGWDTHNDIFDALRDHLLPRFDASFSALVEDLDQRGLLDNTLVVCMGEFGRAPQVAVERKFAGVSPGRKHWASVYSLAMAGAGVQRGSIVGASDRLGAEPLTNRYGPWDVAATIFHALGFDPAQHYTDSLGRPFPVSIGNVMSAIYRG